MPEARVDFGGYLNIKQKCYLIVYMDLDFFFRGGGGGGEGSKGPASDKGGSDKCLPFQNPYPGKLRGV